MSKVIMFSRSFPSYHPKAGHPTFFVEKIYNKIWDDIQISCVCGVPELLEYLNPNCEYKLDDCLDSEVADLKSHTIRVGRRFRVGDKFSPRVWSGKPYRSKQITIAPDIEVLKTWDIEIAIGLMGIRIDGDWHFEDYETLLASLAKNDGLSVDDFKSWFNTTSFEGQVICWNKDIEY